VRIPPSFKGTPRAVPDIGKLPKNVDEKIFATFLKNVDGKILTTVQKLLIKNVKARGAFWDMNPLSGLFGSLWAL
jgi:hypothetical protein